MSKRILTQTQVVQKIRRIAFEIYENNLSENQIVLAGIVGGGYALAQLLAEQLNQICSIEVQLMQIMLNKDQPHQQLASFNIEASELVGKVIVVVDDVLNTGRTLAYGLSPFLGVAIKKVQVAVMVNRGHRSFPISADYVGYALSTTLNNHIFVGLEADQIGVFLS